jgi:polyisoprenoid-binding protein YceI
MKRLLLSVAFVGAIYALPAGAEETKAAAERVAPASSKAMVYQLDPGHTSATWTVGHMGFSHFTGKFSNITGTLTLDEENPANSKVDVSINTADFVTGVPKLDEHMKTKDFLDTAKFPNATFVSDKVEVTGKDTAKVTGTLTLLGVSKPVTLDVKLNKQGEHPMMHKNWAGFDASTTLKRSDWGMSFGVPNVSDEVKIEIEAEAGAS